MKGDRNMKGRTLASLLLAGLPWLVAAQSNDDLYFVPKKKVETEKTTAAPVRRTVTSQTPGTTVYAAPGSTVVVKDAAGKMRDVDEYNRRYTSRDNTFSMQNDTLYIEEKPAGERGEWVNGFEGSQDDYEYAMRIVRFRSPAYAIPISSPLYWDVVYGAFPSWDWNVYDDGLYAYVFPTYSNPLWWDWRWNWSLSGPRWGWSWNWHSPWYYSGWYSPYWYGGYWGGWYGGWYAGYWGGWHHHYPYYGWGGWQGRPVRNPGGRYRGLDGYSRPDSRRLSGGTRYAGSGVSSRPGRNVAGNVSSVHTTDGIRYTPARTDQTGRVRSIGRVVNPSSNVNAGVRPTRGNGATSTVGSGGRVDPRRNVSPGTAGNGRSSYTRPNSYTRPRTSSGIGGGRSTYTRPSSTRSNVNRPNTTRSTRSYTNPGRSSFGRSGGSSFRSSGGGYGGGGRSSGGGSARSAGGGRR